MAAVAARLRRAATSSGVSPLLDKNIIFSILKSGYFDSLNRKLAMKPLTRGFIFTAILAILFIPIVALIEFIMKPGGQLASLLFSQLNMPDYFLIHFLIRLIIGLILVYFIGLLVPPILKSQRFQKFLKSKEKFIPGIIRFIISIIPKDVDQSNLLNKKEVEWDAEGEDRRRIGLLIGPIEGRPGWMRVVELSVGVPIGGAMRSIHEDKLYKTGRTGEQLIPELIAFGLNLHRSTSNNTLEGLKKA